MKLRLLSFVLLLALLPSLASCGGQGGSFVLYNKMNTDVAITLYTGGTKRSSNALASDCERLLDEAERCFSRTALGAELAILNASTDMAVPVSPMLAEMLARSLALAQETNGCFDPTVGILSDLYDIGGSRPLPSEADVLAAMPYIGYRAVAVAGDTVSRIPGTVLDLGAIAKGYMAEQLVRYLTEAGVRGGVLSLGGNIATFGEKKDGSAFCIAIRSPFEGSGTAGVLSLRGEHYISTSGAYERYRVDEAGNRYHHIFDTHTGAPAVSDLASVTVVAKNGARADAWSTALYVLGYEQAIAAWQAAVVPFDMVLIREDGEIFVTPGLSFSQNS
jgi:thiamine biosynthesis lipoprotein